LAAVLDLSPILEKFCTLHVKMAAPDNSSVPTDAALRLGEWNGANTTEETLMLNFQSNI